MIYLKKERGINRDHRSFKVHQYDKIPKLMYVNLSDASMLYVEADTISKYAYVIAQFGSHKESVFCAYNEHEDDLVLQKIWDIMFVNRDGHQHLTPEDLEKFTGVEHVRSVYWEGFSDEIEVLATYRD